MSVRSLSREGSCGPVLTPEDKFSLAMIALIAELGPRAKVIFVAENEAAPEGAKPLTQSCRLSQEHIQTLESELWITRQNTREGDRRDPKNSIPKKVAVFLCSYLQQQQKKLPSSAQQH